jgi:hypothetical protein
VIRFRFLGMAHYLAAWKRGDPRISPAARAFFAGLLTPCDDVVAAFDEGVIGFLRFSTALKRNKVILYAAGTWVEPEYRGGRVPGKAGEHVHIARALWARAMRKHDPDVVIVRTVSAEGRGFVGSLVKWYSHVAFEVTA